MNENELQEIVQENKSNFSMNVLDKNFKIDEIEIFQTDNPINEPTTRGGVYFADLKELKIQATIFDTSVSEHLSKAMLGPNKDFLDILFQAEMKDTKKISIISNLTNSMQNSSKLVLYLKLIDAEIKS
tara:strand:- start:5763 stop:6146 length:384 start_codon:yes stop_codon:yes gene_type:complete